MPLAETSFTPQQKQYLLIGQGIVPGFTNIVINGLIGWFTFRGVEQIPVLGWDSSAIGDTLGTCYLLPAITCLIATPIVRHHVKSGAVAPLVAKSIIAQKLSCCSVLLRSVLFGGTCFAILAPVAAVAYLCLGSDTLPKQSFLWFKTISSGIFGAMVTPLIAYVAMTDNSAGKHQA